LFEPPIVHELEQIASYLAALPPMIVLAKVEGPSALLTAGLPALFAALGHGHLEVIASSLALAPAD
jgi:hypothetical protein